MGIQFSPARPSYQNEPILMPKQTAYFIVNELTFIPDNICCTFNRDDWRIFRLALTDPR